MEKAKMYEPNFEPLFRSLYYLLLKYQQSNSAGIYFPGLRKFPQLLLRNFSVTVDVQVFVFPT